MRFARNFAAAILAAVLFPLSIPTDTAQPFLLICVRGQDSPYFLAGTVSPDTEFDSLGRSPDSLDMTSMHAKLLKKTAEGFGISWAVEQRVRGVETTRFSEELVVPWNQKKPLRSVPGLIIEAFYSDRPAKERCDLVPNQALERTAEQRANLLSMTSTLKSEAQLALVSDRSACSR